MSSLFAPKVSENKVSPLFVAVRDSKGYAAARALMDEIFSEYQDRDGNFVKDFQTTGFSARVWELSLYAFMTEAGLPLDTSHATPDYLVGGATPMAIEAVTNQPAGAIPPSTTPARGALPQVPDDLEVAQAEFVFQFGKALRAKLQKRFAQNLAYWDLPQIHGKPFILAAQSFYSESSLFHSVTFAAEYLYGRRWSSSRDESGRLQVRTHAIKSHAWNGKTIPSGLFQQDEGRHLSAVLFSNAGTAAQFNRIGAQRGMGRPDVHIIRAGTCADPDPDADMPLEFRYLVGDPHSPEEDFSQSIHVLHNPNADICLPDGAFGNATEHRIDPGSGELVTTHRSGFSPFSSLTVIFTGSPPRSGQ